MADEAPNEEVVEPKTSLVSKLTIPLVVGIVSCLLGIGIAIMCPGLFGLQKVAQKQAETPLFVHSFGDVVVNLNDQRMNRYLRLGISMMVEGTPKDEKEFETTMEKKKSLLTSWLLSYLADMSMEDVRGAAGQNRLRREIQNAFNETLFPDGNDRIHELLFEEFSIQ